MRHGLVCLGVVLLTGFSISTAQQQEKQEKSKENAAAPAAVVATTDAAKPAAAAERFDEFAQDVANANACIECGFCEPKCPSRGLTL